MDRSTKINISLILFSVIAIILYIGLWYLTTNVAVTKTAFIKIIERRSMHVLAMTVSAILIAFASLMFQTITNNRILTPSMLGFDAIYVATQTFIVFLLGTNTLIFNNAIFNFIISTTLMLVITLILYKFILKNNKNQVFILLLVGMVISTLLRSVTGFIQRIMDPNELDAALSQSMVSIGNINTSIIYFVIPIMVVLIILFYKNHREYDTMALGSDIAINLGVNYYKKTNQTMVYIAISMAIATALIGPITFLGLLVVNVARELFKSYSHKVIMIASSLISIIVIVIGQLLVEQLTLGVPVTVVINLVGGTYMMYLIWRVNSNDKIKKH